MLFEKQYCFCCDLHIFHDENFQYAHCGGLVMNGE